MDFTRKARFVAGGHMTEPPSSLAYLSVVSRETEKVYFTAGTEFGAKKGQYVVVIRALYGLEISGAAWRAFLVQTMHDLGFKSCNADPDLWIKPGVKNDGTKYWEYVLIYVDDTLCMSHTPGVVMGCISKLYRLKEDPKTGK
eukprot:11670140-Ditylum_brightwellii.AAC.1